MGVGHPHGQQPLPSSPPEPDTSSLRQKALGHSSASRAASVHGLVGGTWCPCDGERWGLGPGRGGAWPATSGGRERVAPDSLCGGSLCQWLQPQASSGHRQCWVQWLGTEAGQVATGAPDVGGGGHAMLLRLPGKRPVLCRQWGVVTLDTLGAPQPDVGWSWRWPQTATGLILPLDRPGGTPPSCKGRCQRSGSCRGQVMVQGHSPRG